MCRYFQYVKAPTVSPKPNCWLVISYNLHPIYPRTRCHIYFLDYLVWIGELEQILFAMRRIWSKYWSEVFSIYNWIRRMVLESCTDKNHALESCTDMNHALESCTDKKEIAKIMLKWTMKTVVVVKVYMKHQIYLCTSWLYSIPSFISRCNRTSPVQWNHI